MKGKKQYAAQPRKQFDHAEYKASVGAANAWRKARVDALVEACKGSDEDIEKALVALTFTAVKPTDTGFQRSDIEHFVEVFTKKLDGGFTKPDGTLTKGLRTAFEGKMAFVGRCNRKAAEGGRSTVESRNRRDDVLEEAHEVHAKIVLFERVILALRTALSDRLARAKGRPVTTPILVKDTVSAEVSA